MVEEGITTLVNPEPQGEQSIQHELSPEERWRQSQKENEQWVSDEYTFPKPNELITQLEELGLHEHVIAYKAVIELAESVRDAGGQLVIIGGAVRDIILDKTPKDFDVEIYGLPSETAKELAKKVGEATEAGKVFANLKVRPEGVTQEHLYLDVSLPRRDTKTGAGHKGFVIATDPYMNFKEATSRRDFTMNTLCADPLTGKIYEPHGGIADLNRRILKVTDPEKFGEDPLRALRAIQFCARYGLEVDEGSRKVIRKIPAEELATLPPERLREEIKKLLRAKDPARGLELGMELGVWEKLFPIFMELQKTKQDPKWHPEGNVWEHTKLVVKAGAELVRARNLWKTDADRAFAIMLACLCHDFGKPSTTKVEARRLPSEEIETHITSKGHCEAGVAPAEKFLKQIGIPHKIIKQVLPLIKEHLTIVTLYRQQSGINAVVRLLRRLAPATLEDLIIVTWADQLGRGHAEEAGVEADSDIETVPEAIKWIEEMAKNIKVDKNQRPVDPISGNWIIAQDEKAFSRRPGPKFGELKEIINDIVRMLSGDEAKEKALEEIAKIIKEANGDIEKMLETLKTLEEKYASEEVR